MNDAEFAEAVEQRTGRKFSEVVEIVTGYFGEEWQQCEIYIATSADKSGTDEIDVIERLVAKALEKTPKVEVLKKNVLAELGHEPSTDEDPWARFKDRVPDVEQVQKLRRRDDTDMWSG